jgi:hypothetical protein
MACFNEPARARKRSRANALIVAIGLCLGPGLGCPTPKDDEARGSAEQATRRPAPRIVASRERRDPLSAVAASYPDEEYASDELVEAVRFVYRVEIRSPPYFGRLPPAAPRMSAELLIDATPDRLRATFAGPGWPLSAGSQVRLRADRDGTYVFDDRGGRPYARGLLSEWFQNGTVENKHKPYLGIQPPLSREATRVGTLVCAFLAEWTGRGRENHAWRCERGSPARFLFGPWVAERTAELPVQLPRSSLRADEADPPNDIESARSGMLIPTHLVSRLAPSHERTIGTEGTGLYVKNELDGRIIIVAGGIPIGWVDPGEGIEFTDLHPGTHFIGGMRPLGTTAWAPRYVAVPATVVMSRP